MRAVALLVTVTTAMAMAAATPADAAKRKMVKQAAVESTTPANSNEQSARLVRDSLPVFLPTWSIPLYLKAKEQR